MNRAAVNTHLSDPSALQGGDWLVGVLLGPVEICCELHWEAPHRARARPQHCGQWGAGAEMAWAGGGVQDEDLGDPEAGKKLTESPRRRYIL